MRKMFLTAVALAPLVAASAAHAETVISNTRTTPIATATANNGAADDVRIDDGGAIEVSSGAAVTVNSNNDFTNEGDIEMEDSADGSTGVLVVGPVTADITNDGSISIDDGYAPEDDDEDGDLDGPWAEGTNRAGIRVNGDLTGNVTNSDSGIIAVDGNQSYGILIDGALTGDLSSEGQIRVVGDESFGIRTTGAVNGDVSVGGNIAVVGEDTTGVSLEGDISGALNIHGTITSTGYRFTQRPSDEIIEELEPDEDLLQGGPAVAISGSVAGGILFDRTPLDLDEDDDDEDDDGIPDDEETTAQITSVGGAPAVLIGSATDATTIGLVGTDDFAYGLIIRGNLSGSGIYDDVDAVALQIGIEGGGTVDIAGGIRTSEGAISATAFEAEAIGILLNSGVTAPVIWQDAQLQAAILSEVDDDAYAMLIEAGANVDAIYNFNFINASVFGETGDSYAIVDRSGTVDLVENAGVIIAQHVANDDEDDVDDEDDDASNEEITGDEVAIDLSANTTGAVVRNIGIDDGDDGDDDVEDPDADNDGVDDEDEPGIVGDIRFGSGADTLDIQNGAVFGDVSFGAGADSLAINGGGQFRGKISDSDNTLAVTVTDGTIEVENTTAVTVSSLVVGAEGDLVVTVDPTAGTVSGFNVTGTATLADGAGLGVRFASLLQTQTVFTVIDAGDLVAGAIDLTTLTTNTPFAYSATAIVDSTNDQLLLSVVQRTPEQMGMIAAEAAIYDAVYEQLNDSPLLRQQFLNRLTADEFYDLYRQLLPNHSGGPLLSLTAGIDAVRHALSERRVQAERGEATSWLQEINFYADKETLAAYGFDSEGFGVAGGIERSWWSVPGTWGLSFAYTSSDMKDVTAVLDENLTAQLFEVGAYWRLNGENWRIWTRAAGGYAMFDEVREVITPSFTLQYESSWSGYSAAAGIGGSYDVRFGKWYARAEAAMEYFYLYEDAHEETGGGVIGAPFRLAYEEREGHLAKGEVTLNIGRRFGEDGWLTPEIRLGWRQNFSSDLGVTTVRIGNGTLPSTLHPDHIEGGGPMLGFRLTAGSSMGFLGLEGDAILLDEYEFYSLMLRAGYRF